MQLLSLGEVGPGSAIDGVRLDYPYLSRAVIPARAYGRAPPT